MTLKTLQFNTGVKPYNSSYLGKGMSFINGEKHISFQCNNVPENARLLSLCDNRSLYKGRKNVIRRTVYNSTLARYAFFVIN